MGRTNKFEIHDFYCLNCGRSVPLPRKISQQHSGGHRKKLYCPFCKVTVNMVECKSYADKLDFQEAFDRGDYKEEALASIIECEENNGKNLDNIGFTPGT